MEGEGRGRPRDDPRPDAARTHAHAHAATHPHSPPHAHRTHSTTTTHARPLRRLNESSLHAGTHSAHTRAPGPGISRAHTRPSRAMHGRDLMGTTAPRPCLRSNPRPPPHNLHPPRPHTARSPRRALTTPTQGSVWHSTERQGRAGQSRSRGAKHTGHQDAHHGLTLLATRRHTAGTRATASRQHVCCAPSRRAGPTRISTHATQPHDVP